MNLFRSELIKGDNDQGRAMEISKWPPNAYSEVCLVTSTTEFSYTAKILAPSTARKAWDENYSVTFRRWQQMV